MQVRALERAKLPVPPELAALVEAFKEKVARGEARYSSRYTAHTAYDPHLECAASRVSPSSIPLQAMQRQPARNSTTRQPLNPGQRDGAQD